MLDVFFPPLISLNMGLQEEVLHDVMVVCTAAVREVACRKHNDGIQTLSIITCRKHNIWFCASDNLMACDIITNMC